MQTLLYILFALLLLSPVTGELWRIQIAGQGLLPSDLIIPPLFILWGLDKLKNDRKLRLGKIGRAVVLFLFVILAVNVFNLLRFDLSQMVTGFVYLGRFAMYVLVAIIGFDLLSRDPSGRFKKLVLTTMMISFFLLIVLGFLQLHFFPSFLELGMQNKGWDPHIGRLLSTWFDPNFMGGFFAFMLPVSLGLSLYFYRHKSWKQAILFGALSFLGLMALYFTYSRSSYLALMVGLGLFTFFKSRRLLVLFVLFLVIGFSLSSRVQQRTVDAWESARSLVGIEDQKPLDPTSQFRVDSWNFALGIIKDYPVFGAGYGRYADEFYERSRGPMQDHSSSGSDSSLLTLWAQAGILGLLSYLWIFFVAFAISLKPIWKKDALESYLQLGLLCGLFALLAHSFFVNSLLFAHMMVFLWTGMALMDTDR